MPWGGNGMTVYIAVGFAAAAVLWLLIWSVKGLMLTPVRFGQSTSGCLNISIHGAEPELEYTLRSLMWLRENGTLKADIHIFACAPDAETRGIAQRFSAQYRCIEYTEDG